MRRALVTFAVMIGHDLIGHDWMITSAHATEGVFVCTNFNATTNVCTEYGSAVQGASLEDVGFGADEIGILIGWGMGLVVLFAALGHCYGSVLRFMENLYRD